MHSPKCGLEGVSRRLPRNALALEWGDDAVDATTSTDGECFWEKTSEAKRLTRS